MEEREKVITVYIIGLCVCSLTDLWMDQGDGLHIFLNSLQFQSFLHGFVAYGHSGEEVVHSNCGAWAGPLSVRLLETLQNPIPTQSTI